MSHQTEWRPIGAFPPYEVSNDGAVRNSSTGHVLRPTATDRGYLYVSLQSAGKKYNRKVSRLVAKAFLGPPPTTRHQCNHKNGVKDDNRVENLEWVTPAENTRHAIYELGVGITRGSRIGSAKLTESVVLEARRRYAAGGVTQQELADEYGVKDPTMNRAILGITWRHVLMPQAAGRGE